MDSLRKKISNLKLNIKFTILIVCIVMIPVGVLACVLLHNLVQTTKKESLSYMEYMLDRDEKQLATCVDSVNMVMQFFLSDTGILEMLNASVTGKTLTTKEILNYYDTDIAALERLVSNNPLLYGVHVYSSRDNVQEMMPILYNHSRMEQMEWYTEDPMKLEGWHFNYYDTLFSSVVMQKDEPLAAYVTAIHDYHNGVIGYIEVVMKMETIFPELYEDRAYEWSCLVSDQDERIYSSNDGEEKSELFTFMLGKIKDTSEANCFYMRYGNRRWTIAYLPVKEFGGGMVCLRDIAAGSDMNLTHLGVAVILIMVTILLAYLVNGIVKHLLRHLYEILKTIHEVQKGRLEERIEVVSDDEMGELATELNHMLDRIQVLMQENFDRELLAKNSQIRALQNQINAHFIYNVLESIKMMAEIDEEYTISDAVTSLGKLLRYSMRWVNGNVLVSEELEYIRNYIVLINLRFDNEITLSVKLPDELLEQEIPKMSLQPIVENAVLHGLEEMMEDSTIYIKGIMDGEDCVIEVSDAGIGMTEEQVKHLEEKIAGKLEADGGNGHGIGLKNVQDRIHIAFGERYGLKIYSKEGCYTKVEVRLPIRRRTADRAFLQENVKTT